MEPKMMKQMTTSLCLMLIAAAALAQGGELDLPGLKKQLAHPDYAVRKAAVDVFLAAGRARPLKKQEIGLLLPPLKSDSDWRIKVRITAVLPFAADKAQVLPPLMAALRERGDEDSGGGNLQIYSCEALARIGDPKALPAMREWLAFLNANPKEFKLLKEDLIEHTRQRIKKLEDKTKERGSNKPDARDGL